MSERKLANCPFCGGEIEHYTLDYIGPRVVGLNVKCDKCHMSLWIDINDGLRSDSLTDVMMDAIDIFNNRPDSCSNSNHCENFTN